MTFAFMGPLLRFVGFQREVTVNGATVLASLHALCETYPELRPVLLDADGQLRTVHRVCLNDRVITRAELNEPTSQDDRVVILTAIAGG